MSKSSSVPDAWDDDWETLADKPDTSEPKKPVKLSQKERRAQHAQLQKELWESADSPKPQEFFLAARNEVPLQTELKPAIKLLSRKPPSQPKISTRANGVGADVAGLSLNDDDEDSEEEARRKAAETFAERQARAQREREEKQRKYDEVREKLFGPSNPSSDDAQSRRASPSNRQPRGKGKGRSDRGGHSNANASSADQSPARGVNQKRNQQQLFDPSYSAKPNSPHIQRRDAGDSSSGPGTPVEQQQPIRAPRGPDGSAGFGGRGRGKNPVSPGGCDIRG